MVLFYFQTLLPVLNKLPYGNQVDKSILYIIIDLF